MPIPRHFVWAGLDFIFDRDGTPVLLEANRSSHMLGEYLYFFGNERPFELTAAVMNAADGPPCLLWRRNDPLPDADEDACFIGRHLAEYLREPPLIANVEENQDPRSELLLRDGSRVRPGSLFRWWYGLPWSYEREGVRVINSNAAWVAVRDKHVCYESLRSAKHFRVPHSFAVNSVTEVQQILAEEENIFAGGYVIKPRVGWGGQGVQVAELGDVPQPFSGKCLLSERIIPELRRGRYWDVRAFVMAGEYLGGIIHASRSANTNYWQGGEPERLEVSLAERLAPAAREAVQLLDDAADAIHRLPEAPESELTTVRY